LRASALKGASTTLHGDRERAINQTSELTPHGSGGPGRDQQIHGSASDAVAARSVGSSSPLAKETEKSAGAEGGAGTKPAACCRFCSQIHDLAIRAVSPARLPPAGPLGRLSQLFDFLGERAGNRTRDLLIKSLMAADSCVFLTFSVSPQLLVNQWHGGFSCFPPDSGVILNLLTGCLPCLPYAYRSGKSEGRDHAEGKDYETLG
jgi:hypothetical protein